MLTENTVTSPTATPVENGDAKLGNLSLDKAAQHLMKLSQRAEPEKPVEVLDSPEVVPAEKPQANEPTSEPVVAEATVQESEGEETAESQEQAESESDGVLSQLSSLDPKSQEVARALLDKQKEKMAGKFDRRISTEIAKKHTADQQIQSLMQQLEELKSQPKAVEQPAAPVPLANPNNPLSNINDINALTQEWQKAKDALRTSEDLLAQMEDNGMDAIDYGGQQFDRKAIKTAMRNAKRVVEDHAPQQAQYLQTRHQTTQQAFETFPWFKDRNSTEYVMAQRFMSDPSVAARSDRDLVVGFLVEGYKAVEYRKKGSSTPAPKPTPKAKPPASQTEFSASSSPTRASDSEVNRSRSNSEIDKLSNKKGGLTIAEAARMLLHKENLHQKR